MGKNPINTNFSVLNPLTDNAEVIAEAPGIGIILTSGEFLKIKSMSSLPGSDIPGVPASVIKARLFPSRRSFNISYFFSSDEC